MSASSVARKVFLKREVRGEGVTSLEALFTDMVCRKAPPYMNPWRWMGYDSREKIALGSISGTKSRGSEATELQPGRDEDWRNIVRSFSNLCENPRRSAVLWSKIFKDSYTKHFECHFWYPKALSILVALTVCTSLQQKKKGKLSVHIHTSACEKKKKNIGHNPVLCSFSLSELLAGVNGPRVVFRLWMGFTEDNLLVYTFWDSLYTIMRDRWKQLWSSVEFRDKTMTPGG